MLCPEKQQLFEWNSPFASMVAKCVNDLAWEKQCEHIVACSFVVDKGADIRDIAQVFFFYVNDEFCLVDDLSEVVPIKENEVLMELFLNC